MGTGVEPRAHVPEHLHVLQEGGQASKGTEVPGTRPEETVQAVDLLVYSQDHPLVLRWARDV